MRPYGLQLALGFSHPIEYKAPTGIKLHRAAADAGRRSTARTRQLVGQVAAEIAQPASARAVQGQGHQVRRRSRFAARPVRREASNHASEFQRRASSSAIAATSACARRCTGTPERPRLVVFRSLKHITAQLVDDAAARTIATVSSTEVGEGKKTEKSLEVGKQHRRRRPRTRGSRRSCSIVPGTSITAA